MNKTLWRPGMKMVDKRDPDNWWRMVDSWAGDGGPPDEMWCNGHGDISCSDNEPSAEWAVLRWGGYGVPDMSDAATALMVSAAP